MEEGAEDDLGASSGRQSHPNHEYEFEGVVEREPVNGIDGRFDDGEEGIHDPVGQPLRIIGLAGAEQSFQAVIRGQGEAGGVDEEFAGDVEEDEEEV